MQTLGQRFSPGDLRALTEAIVTGLSGALGTSTQSGGGLTNTELRATPLAITVASLPLPAGAATENTLGAVNTKLGGTIQVAGTFWPLTQPVSGSISVTNFPASQAVTGTFWQATQPVSGTVTVGNASLPVTGSFFQATQPISVVSLPLPTGASTEATLSAVNTKLAATLVTRETPCTNVGTATGASGAAVTLTLAAAGAGLFHYISAIEILLYSAAARTGSATPWVVTSTNLTGNPAWTFSTAGAIGATERLYMQLEQPLKATAANVATTIVAPVATGGIWRITAYFYTST